MITERSATGRPTGPVVLRNPYAAAGEALIAAGESEVETTPVPRRTVRGVVAAYVSLTKPQIVELLLVTTVPAMMLAAKGLPSVGLVAVVLVGGGGGGAGGGARPRPDSPARSPHGRPHSVELR